MEPKLGGYNTLEVIKRVDFGVYLDGGEEGDILLPNRYVPDGTSPGDTLRVFLYLDNEERLIATTLEPKVQVGEFAYLQVVWTNQYGAFLDWGLMKDLFVPFSEQRITMSKNKSYFIYCHIDEDSNRIMATSRIDHFISNEHPDFNAGDRVNIIIWQRTSLGYKAIIENKYAGLLYDNELFRHLEIGDKLEAYVKQIRDDNKIDLIIQKNNVEFVDDFAKQFYDYLKLHDGHTAFCDKTPPDEIYNEFGVSKKIFKKGIGELYRMQLIQISDNGTEIKNRDSHTE